MERAPGCLMASPGLWSSPTKQRKVSYHKSTPTHQEALPGLEGKTGLPQMADNARVNKTLTWGHLSFYLLKKAY